VSFQLDLSLGYTPNSHGVFCAIQLGGRFFVGRRARTIFDKIGSIFFFKSKFINASTRYSFWALHIFVMNQTLVLLFMLSTTSVGWVNHLPVKKHATKWSKKLTREEICANYAPHRPLQNVEFQHNQLKMVSSSLLHLHQPSTTKIAEENKETLTFLN